MISIVRTDSGRNAQVSQFCRAMLYGNKPSCATVYEVSQDGTVGGCWQNVLINLIAAINQCPAGVVYVCEYDCLYSPSYFRRGVAANSLNYVFASSIFYLTSGGYVIRKSIPLSTLAGERDVLLSALHHRLRTAIEAKRKPKKLEPKEETGFPVSLHELAEPMLDVRHGKNLTGTVRANRGNVTSGELPFWGDAATLWTKIHE